MTNCRYGLIGPTCEQTYASLHITLYRRSQWVYFLLGSIGIIASAFQYGRAARNSGSPIQKRAYCVTFFCSATFLVRALDPESYAGAIPRIVEFLLTESCTAALYSVLVDSAFFWMLITHGNTNLKRSWRSMATEQTIILFIWIYYVGFDIIALDGKGFYRIPKVYRYIGDAVILVATLTTLLIYGWQVLQRVREIDSMEDAEIPAGLMRSISTMDEAGMLGRNMYTSRPLTSPHYLSHLQKKPFQRFRRMKRVLCVTAVFSVISLAVQFFSIFTVTDERNEKACSTTGELCQNLRFTIKLLHYVQVLGIWGVMWAFGRIQKRSTALQISRERLSNLL